MADILSQDEVDLLLSAVAEGDVVGEEDEMGVADEGPHLTTYDFRRPERVSKEQLKGLQSLFEAFAREASIVLPPFLRTVVRLDLVSIDQLTYDEFILSIARPTALSVINMSPLEGSGIIELSPTLVFPIVDRLLGGKGQALSEPRELTEIENRIVYRIMLMLLDSLKRSWEQLIDFRLSVKNQESDPLIVQIVAGSEMVILVGYELHVGETAGAMNVCIPLLVLNPILDKISQQAHYMRRMTPEVAKRTKSVISRIVRSANVNMNAILGQANLTMNDVANLQVGDIVQLNSGMNDPIAVDVEGIKSFLAHPGRRGEHSAIQLSQVIAE